ncbi:MAG: hypothetical protein WEB88_16460 [Gemmatimonadota bacterium]
MLRTGAVLALTLLVGCGESSDAGDPQDPRNVSPASAQDTTAVAAWRMAPEPRLTLGDRDDDPMHAFRAVNLAARLTNGDLAVVDWRLDPHVRYFDNLGNSIGSAGPDGAGPGEIRNARSSTRGQGDTLHVWDPTTDRLTSYAGRGELVGTTALDTRDLPMAGGGMPVFTPMYIHGVGDGSLAVEPVTYGGPIPADDGVYQPRTVLPLYRADGERAGVVDSILGSEMFWFQRGGDFRPYGAVLRITGGGGRLFVSTGTEPAIRVHGGGGRLERLVPLPWKPLSVGAAEAAAYREARVLRMAESARDIVRRQLDAAPFPDHMPYHRLLLAGRDGSLWVERYGGPERTEREWAVLHADGRWIARLTMPLAQEPLEAGADYVLVRERDDMGRELVRLYDLITGD